MDGMDQERDWVDDDSLTAEETLARFEQLEPLTVAPRQKVTITHQPDLRYPVDRPVHRSAQRLHVTRRVPAVA